MSNEFLEKIEMTLEQAQDTLSHIVSQKIRWGKQYDASDIGITKLTEALVLIAYAENSETAELRTSLAKANRQVGASNARETKLKKKMEGLQNEVDNLNALVERLSRSGDDEASPEGREGED